MLIDKLRGCYLMAGGTTNPLTGMFLQSLAMVVMLWPLVIIGASDNPLFIALGGAILMGIIWIPYGWAADDPAGLRHAVLRVALSYCAYIFAPTALKGSAICAAVLVCYFYSLLTMKRSELDQPVPGAV